MALFALLTAAGLVLLTTGGADEPAAPRSSPEIILGGSETPESRSRDERRLDPESDSSADPDRRRLESALNAGVERAAAFGGSVEAAIMVDRWASPAVVASEPGGTDLSMRAWSMSKAFTAVALLRELGWAERPGKATSPEVDEALAGALTRSENCRQRRIVLELQRSVGGSPTAAGHAVAETLALAGATSDISDEAETPEPTCLAFLETQRELSNPLSPGLLLGTSTWRIKDAVRFVHALGADTYGRAVSERILALMRAPKAVSREAPPGDFTAAADWGAGRALAEFRPAYKAGWGGTNQGSFFAGQIALVERPSGGLAAVAVAFHPAAQPPKDDPGLTDAPAAIEAVMAAIARAL